MSDYLCIAPGVKLGKNVKLSKFINLYGCEVGDNTKIGAFVEVLPGKDGLVHISQISDKYVQEITDHVTVGARVLVKIIGE